MNNIKALWVCGQDPKQNIHSPVLFIIDTTYLWYNTFYFELELFPLTWFLDCIILNSDTSGNQIIIKDYFMNSMKQCYYMLLHKTQLLQAKWDYCHHISNLMKPNTMKSRSTRLLKIWCILIQNSWYWQKISNCDQICGKRIPKDLSVLWCLLMLGCVGYDKCPDILRFNNMDIDIEP